MLSIENGIVVGGCIQIAKFQLHLYPSLAIDFLSCACYDFRIIASMRRCVCAAERGIGSTIFSKHKRTVCIYSNNSEGCLVSV